MNMMFAIYFVFNILASYFNGKDELKFNDSRQKILEIYSHYQAEKDFGINKAKLEISDTGFLRYKTTSTNRIAYYSVNTSKVAEIIYLGNENAGWLAIKCEKESVIYQTYQDKDGNMDDMVNIIKIPLKNIDFNDLNIFLHSFNDLKSNIN